jgi:lactose/L-arabinose transport system ATP-binding protein
MSGVTLNNVIKKYGDVPGDHRIGNEIRRRWFCVFVGPSGCGKSTRGWLRDWKKRQAAPGIGERDVMRTSGVAMVFRPTHFTRI